MIIKWDNSFRVNIEDVDNQHKKLVEIVNRLADAMADGTGKHSLAAIFDELVSYTKVHFETEERILKLVNYPELSTHQDEHAEFVDKLTDFQIKFDRSQLGLSIEVMNFLCDWVRSHIKKSDKHYAQFIADKGLLRT